MPRKKNWSPEVEPLLKLRSLNASFYHQMLRQIPTDTERINDWYRTTKTLIHELAADAGYSAEDFDKLTCLQDGD